MYATTARVSSAACERFRSTGRSKSRPQRLRGLTRGAERPAARDLLEHDPAPSFAIALAEQAQRGLDSLNLVAHGLGELGDPEWLRRDDEQRLDRPRERVDRIRRDQAERALHASTSSSRRAARGDADRGERRRLLERDLTGAAQLQQREERDRLLDARQPCHLVVEIEPLTASENRPELLEEPRHRREPKLEMRERDLRWLSRKHPQRRRERLGILLRQPALATRRKRRGAEPEVPVTLVRKPFREPLRCALDPPVLLEAPCQLFRRFLGLEILDVRLTGEEATCLQLQQRRDQDQELAAGVQVELIALGEPLDEREHDPRHVDLDERQLLLQDEGEEQVERALERVEVELQFSDTHGHGG